MKPRARVLAALVLLPLPGGAAAQSAKVEGRCERLVIAGQDITQNCKERLVSTLTPGVVSVDFAAWDGQTLSFSGPGAREADAADTAEASRPITLVTPGQSGKSGVARSPTPATGACRFSTPEPGRTLIACEASAQGKAYSGIFLTEAKPASGGGKPASGEGKPASGEGKPASGEGKPASGQGRP